MKTIRPFVEITFDLCKGCSLCTIECPKKCLVMSDKINIMGYTHAEYTGEGCIGCGQCFYACPEPGAVTVYKKIKKNG